MTKQSKEEFIYKIMCNKYGKDKIDKHFKKYIPLINQAEQQKDSDPYKIVNRIYDHLKENDMLYTNEMIVKELRFFAAIAIHPKFWESDNLPHGFTTFMKKIDKDFDKPIGTNVFEVMQALIKMGFEVLCEKHGPELLKQFMPLITASRKKQDTQQFTEMISSLQQAKDLKQKGLLN